MKQKKIFQLKWKTTCLSENQQTAQLSTSERLVHFNKLGSVLTLHIHLCIIL